MTPTGLGGLALTLLSSNRLALAPAWLLQIFGVLVGCGRRHRAVLRSGTAPPSGWEDGRDRLVFIVTRHCCALVRRAGLSWGQDWGNVDPRQARLRALTCFVL